MPLRGRGIGVISHCTKGNLLLKRSELYVAKAVKAARRENRVVRYFRETRSELRKVIWPTRQEAMNLTLVVIAVTVAMSALLGLVDYLFSQLFGLIVR